MQRTLCLYFVLSLLLVSCSSESGIEGQWKNGDGSLVRFDDNGQAWLGQEGYTDEAVCSYTVVSDTIVLSTFPESSDSVYTTFRMLLSDDTLRILAIGRHESGFQQIIPIEHFAFQSGKSVEKLAFFRITE